jgi:hypothetical protein
MSPSSSPVQGHDTHSSDARAPSHSTTAVKQRAIRHDDPRLSPGLVEEIIEDGRPSLGLTAEGKQIA